MKNRMNIGILFGGKSAEHEVSLQSAKNVFDAMDKEKYRPVLIGIDKTGKWLINEESEFLLNADNPKLISLNGTSDPIVLAPQCSGELSNLSNLNRNIKLDAVFPILHGPFGEDGTVQGLLKLAGIPFVGSGVLGSAVGMDKDIAKRLLRDAGIPIAKYLSIRSHEQIPDIEKIKKELGLPFFVKPANMGSSVGVGKVEKADEYKQAVLEAFSFDNKIILEENVAGREIECSVLGNEDPIASVPGEVITNHQFYTYKAKYIDEHGAALEVPAKISADTGKRIQKLAVKVFQTLSCEGMGRVDFFLTENDEIIVNEINTIPGFTKISMYPRLWEASGITYTQLIDRLIELAVGKFEKEQALRTKYFE